MSVAVESCYSINISQFGSCKRNFKNNNKSPAEESSFETPKDWIETADYQLLKSVMSTMPQDIFNYWKEIQRTWKRCSSSSKIASACLRHSVEILNSFGRYGGSGTETLRLQNTLGTISDRIYLQAIYERSRWAAKCIKFCRPRRSIFPSFSLCLIHFK